MFSNYRRVHPKRIFMKRFITLLTLWLLASISIAIAATADDEAVVYLGQVEKRIMAVWKLPPRTKGLQVTLRYTLTANGSVSFIRVETSSGDQNFDDSAVQAVRRASPFPPPPKSFPTGDLRMVLDPTDSAAAQTPHPTNGKNDLMIFMGHGRIVALFLPSCIGGR